MALKIDVFEGVPTSDLTGMGKAMARFAVNALMPPDQFKKLLGEVDEQTREECRRILGDCNERHIAEVHSAAMAEFQRLRAALPTAGGLH